MHGRLWLIAGTGEGPLLARVLLERGWRLRVSVVTQGASQAYPMHPHLELRVGALAGAEALRSELEAAERQGEPFHWVIDASHPFASRITAAAVEATLQRPGQLLRLHRPFVTTPRAIQLHHLGDLNSLLAPQERVLLAIGARQLRAAAQASNTASLHARVLPHPQALRQAIQAGLPPSHIACCRPSSDGALEKALCRHWQIQTILCRQSGGHTEALWQNIHAEEKVRLLLLRRPAEPENIPRLTFPELIERIGIAPDTRDG